MGRTEDIEEKDINTKLKLIISLKKSATLIL